MSPPRVVVISGGLRAPSTTRLLADQLAGAVAASLGAAGEAPAMQTVELRELGHEITDAMLTGFATGRLGEVLEAVAAADGLVVVSPTFSASYSGLFKSFFDVLEPEVLADMPVLLAATGGTERHSLMIEHALRPMFSYLRASPIHTGVYAATSDFGGEGAVRLTARVNRAAGELADAVLARRRARADVGGAVGGGPSSDDGEAEVTPFETLLAGAELPGRSPLRRSGGG